MNCIYKKSNLAKRSGRGLSSERKSPTETRFTRILRAALLDFSVHKIRCCWVSVCFIIIAGSIERDSDLLKLLCARYTRSQEIRLKIHTNIRSHFEIYVIFGNHAVYWEGMTMIWFGTGDNLNIIFLLELI